MPNISVENGQITLPQDVLGRYGLSDSTSIRIVETQGGILLVPLTDEPMCAALLDEIADWQAFGLQTFESFPYESEAP